MNTSISITASAPPGAYRPGKSTSAPTGQGLHAPLTPSQRERLTPQARRAGGNVQPDQGSVREEVGDAVAGITDRHSRPGGARGEGWPSVKRALVISMQTLICAWLIAPLFLSAQDAQAQGPAWDCMDEPGQPECQEARLTDLEALIRAQAPAWRCMDEPGQPECQEGLLNDIEDIIVRDWPRPLVLPMPSIPYTCVKDPGSGHQAVPDPVEANFSSSLSWSIVWTGNLRSFLIGRHTAYADLAGTVEVSGGLRITATSWSDTTVNYLFEEGTTEVLAPSGPTGVIDLGPAPVSFSTPTGVFWSANLHIVLMDLSDGIWTCGVGPAGRTVRKTGTRNAGVKLDYPIAWTAVQDVLAEGIRNQFRRSVQIAVTETP